MAITLREGLGRKLTIAEMDENFLFLSSSYVVNSITGSMTASFADSATSASIADEISQLATASFADSATTASHTDGTASFADYATSASYAISASHEINYETSSSLAETASFARTGDGIFSGSFSGSFDGDGSALTGISSYTVANSADNRVLTSVDASNGNAEANLTFDGTTLAVTNNITTTTITGSLSGSLVQGTSASFSDITVTTLTVTSAERFTTNIQPLDSQIAKISLLNPVTFDWKDNGNEDIGLIAEQVNEVYPTLISRNPDGEIQGIKYTKLISVLVKSIQELKEEVEILKTKIDG